MFHFTWREALALNEFEILVFKFAEISFWHISRGRTSKGRPFPFSPFPFLNRTSMKMNKPPTRFASGHSLSMSLNVTGWSVPDCTPSVRKMPVVPSICVFVGSRSIRLLSLSELRRMTWLVHFSLYSFRFLGFSITAQNMKFVMIQIIHNSKTRVQIRNRPILG